MKILYITSDLNGKDGVSRYSVDLITSVKKLGHEVRVNTFFSFLNFKPDIIHYLSEPLVKTIPWYKNIPTCVTLHGTYAKDLLESDIAKKITGFICVSNFTKNKFSKLLPKNSVVITNGIDTSVFKPIKRPANKIKQILFVGGVKPRKGLKNSITALKVYAQRYSDNFIYNVVGKYDKNDPYYQSLLSETWIKFHGQVSQEKLLEFYHQADLFMMLPVTVGEKFEGFGLVYLEANACGVPCIGSLNSGAEDAIVNGKTGYLVYPDKLDNVAEAINKVLNEKRIKLKDCIQWAEKNDVKKKTEEITKFYISLLT